MIDRFADWKTRADECDLYETALRYGATMKRSGREWSGPCPFCGGDNRFSVNQQKHKWNCRGHGGGHGAIGMAMHIGGLTFMQACEDLTGEPNPSTNQPAAPLSEAEKADRARQRQKAEAKQQARKAQEQAYQEDTREAAQAIWEQGGKIAGTLAEQYLIGRGIELLSFPEVMRFHPSLPYPGAGPMPALLCRVDDLMGNLCAVWRIYLSLDGRKANVPNPKLGLGPAGGGAVRLGGMAHHVGIAEGVETALAASCLTGRKIPVWAALSTAGMIGLEIPMGVSRVTIFPDGDRPLKRKGHEYEPAQPAGRKAAQSLFARLTEEGIRASVAAEPPPGCDYLDMWNASQREVA